MSGNNLLLAVNVDVLCDEQTFRYWYEKQRDLRREKIDKIKSGKIKRLSLGAGIAMDKALSRVGCADAKIITTPEGKLIISDSEVNENNIYFNLSHTGSVAVCALSDAEVGVDVEKPRKFNKSLIDYTFSDSEKRLMDEAGISPTALWTVKESVMKWCGLGLSLSPKLINIYNDGSALRVTIDDERFLEAAKALRLTGYEQGEYHFTVCSAYPDFTDKIEWIL